MLNGACASQGARCDPARNMEAAATDAHKNIEQADIFESDDDEPMEQTA